MGLSTWKAASAVAFVSEIVEVKADSSSVSHTECSCGWRITDRNGERVVQLDSYGSESRKLTGKVSQSLQFDRTQAAVLIAALRAAFPGID